jgi:hypothetical protein
MNKLLLSCMIAAFTLVGLPLLQSDFGATGIQAQAAHAKKHVKVRRAKVKNKYNYVYVPTSSGRPGAWR